ncbi:response regulator [Lachnospiraceae bacterium 46-61]
MYNQLVWDEKYNIGVDIIDKEHQRLFRIINKLFAFEEEEKKSQWACLEGIKYFKEHAMKHFQDEEKYMASIDYKDFKTHKYIHTEFRENTLPALEEELKFTNYSADAIDHFLGVCTGWLIGHTLTEDMAIIGEKTSKWTNRLLGEDHTAIKKTIIQLLYNMFHLESQAISETYSGERFGKAIYYRLLYTTKEDDKKWEIFLVFEEQLLINTVGKIMGITSNKLDTMLINATRYTAQQFVRRVMKHLPSAELYEMSEENLLTYEQFRELFERQNPQVSLLFNTGAGYFSYCVIAPHLLQNSTVTPIDTNNAMAEIARYLSEKEESENEARQIPIQINSAMTEIEKCFAKKELEERKASQKPVNHINNAMAEIEKFFVERENGQIKTNDVMANIEKHFVQSENIQKPIQTSHIIAEIEKYLSKREANQKPIQTSDIIAEIEKYFNQKNSNTNQIKTSEIKEHSKKQQEIQKPKVLVVDDSITIRHGIKELLNKDYDVSLVKSGLSAMQMIILNKPDLILLDYEMPVCDGQQMLAMLRSEEEFADIPVIFLTSKTDQESVRKVISLKPEGYLSKYLKLSDIKQKIDNYFESKKLNTNTIKTNTTLFKDKEYLTIETQKYKKDGTQKPKVLVVDDSITVRQGIKNLLNNHYDVSLVQSVLSAIGSITLDKPDLILLDYEMPVCDGQQMLAMLRSEEEFANIPVIFLTSKTDHESVRKVVSLKPEGYLSKFLKPEDIKQKIDNYFEKKRA